MIDVTFDVRSDAGGKDPDSHSATLRRYHQLLWSKELPTGGALDLVMTTPGVYLHHKSDGREFWLSSDGFIPTYSRWVAMADILNSFTEDEREQFLGLAYTVGGFIVFPGQKVDGKMTLNGARGFTRSIADRMDLTLECIRRHYIGASSPLAAVLQRYGGWFDLFGDFDGYVRFFLLDDLLTDDRRSVGFFLPFDDFAPPSVPRDASTYRDYRRTTMAFVEARNRRIADYPLP